MYVRIARFEGAAPDQLDGMIEGIRRQIAESRERAAAGDVSDDESAGMNALRRAVVAVERESGRTASLMFADSEEDMRKVDTWLNSLSPGPSGGGRTSVEIYDVANDEQRG